MHNENNIAQDALARARENLAVWHGEISLAEELALLQTTDIATRLVSGKGDVDRYRLEALALLGEALSPSPTLRAQQLSERIALCRALSKSADMGTVPAVHDRETTVAPQEPARIAMLNSPIFSAAADAFFPALPLGEPLFGRSFADVSDEVAAGRAVFGILPLEDTAEGKLFRIYEQIERFELHIAATTDVGGEDGKTVRMALLYKNEAPRLKEKGERVLELLPYGDAHETADLLTVATAFHLSLRRVDSMPLSYKEDGFVQHIVLRTEGGDVHGFLTYLALFMPRTTITADYINIKAREQL